MGGGGPDSHQMSKARALGCVTSGGGCVTSGGGVNESGKQAHSSQAGVYSTTSRHWPPREDLWTKQCCLNSEGKATAPPLGPRSVQLLP